MPADGVIACQNLNFSYDGTPVLTDVTFEVVPGEFIGMIGPNGGGKTTLLKLILGFLKANSGSLTIFGKEPGRAHHDVAYVPQRLPFDRLFPISVEEIVLTGRLVHLPWYGLHSAEDLRLARAALEMVELEAFANRPFGSLSGGQAQRVLIARALVSQPKLLLLDEPTSSVDVEAQAAIYNILMRLRGSMTLVMVTHDLGTVIECVDRVLCVQGIVMPLQPEEVCKHFAVGLYHTPLIMPGDSARAQTEKA